MHFLYKSLYNLFLDITKQIKPTEKSTNKKNSHA